MNNQEMINTSRKWKVSFLLQNGKKVTGYYYRDVKHGCEIAYELIGVGKTYSDGNFTSIDKFCKGDGSLTVHIKDISSITVKSVKMRKSEEREII